MTANILTHVSTGRLRRAQKICLYAPEGFGKSTLAGHFPHPLFLDVEDSTSQLDVSRLSRADLPDLKTVEFALATIATERPCGTLIIDTIDWLEQMALDAVIAEAANPKLQSIEDFGYGKGYTLLKERIIRVLAKLDAVVARGITVVLLAHARINKFEPPDGTGSYDRFELKLTKQVAPLIKEWADMLLFGNWREPGEETGPTAPNAAGSSSSKERLLHCNRTAAWDAKNRHGLADIEPWSIDSISKAFREVDAPWGGAEAPEDPAVVSSERGSEVGLVSPRSGGGGQTLQQPRRGAEVSSSPVSDGGAQAAAAHPPGNPDPAADVELARICLPHAEAVNAYLRAQRRIASSQDWRSMPADFAARVKRNPAGFLKVAGGSLSGKAVAA